LNVTEKSFADLYHDATSSTRLEPAIANVKPCKLPASPHSVSDSVALRRATIGHDRSTSDEPAKRNSTFAKTKSRTGGDWWSQDQLLADESFSGLPGLTNDPISCVHQAAKKCVYPVKCIRLASRSVRTNVALDELVAEDLTATWARHIRSDQLLGRESIKRPEDMTESACQSFMG